VVESTPAGVTPDEFRHVMGHFATGVTVVTALHEGARFGTTASAVASLSLEPPMLLVCLSKESATGKAIERAGAFAVNILCDGQGELARNFARKGGDKFDGIDASEGVRGQPLLGGALAQLECHVAEAVTGGTHWVFFGLIEHANAFGGAPLAYFRGQYGRLELD
jgi:flavin reductase (DIM6/NTAB) family NADH-FMN oxidoreductase RutF